MGERATARPEGVTQEVASAHSERGSPSSHPTQRRIESVEARVRLLVAEHYQFMYRTLRRMGLTEPDAEDAAQEVFLVATRRLESIAPDSERSFLIGTALRVAATHRRGLSRRRELADCERLDRQSDSRPSPEQVADQRMALEAIDTILQGMTEQLRTVFVLFEVEEVTMAEIAEALQVPPGTVASRLRRAREAFRGALQHRRASQTLRLGGMR